MSEVQIKFTTVLLQKSVYIRSCGLLGENILQCMKIFKYGIFLQVPNVKWEDVGGLEDVKKSILDTVQVGFLYDVTALIVTFFFLIWKHNSTLSCKVLLIMLETMHIWCK